MKHKQDVHEKMKTNMTSKNDRMMVDAPWWQRSVVYQIYPRSFCDANGDGIGDIQGITGKLDYIKALGAEVIWLSPVYQSPNDDNGYDISDYRAIHPEFGTMADFDEMLAGMHQRGLRLVMDLVVNHCSDEHSWFQQARTSRDNPFHDWFIWREPVQREGVHAAHREPNNWESVFGGSAWEWNEATGEYYLHMFTRKQPDLNWENPDVREAVYGIMRFWLDKGVDGFRMDVINMISKPHDVHGALPDAPILDAKRFLQSGFWMSCNGPRLLEFLLEMRREVLDHYEVLTVGECPMIPPELAREITDAESGALSMVFQFEHMEVDTVHGNPDGKWAIKPLELPTLKTILDRWQDGLGERGWNSLYWCNHDQPRPVSRFGDPAHRVDSATMLATCLHLMRGTPYVYQGEELGMTNVPFASIADCRDIETLNFHRLATSERGWTDEQAMASIRAKGRDNARVPMPWDDSVNGGFGIGTPWIDVHPDYREVNAASALADPASVFHYYRRLIALRKEHRILTDGRYVPLIPDHPRLFAYLREQDDERWLVACNFSGQDETFDLPEAVAGQIGEMIIGNRGMPPQAGSRSLVLRPWEARAHQIETIANMRTKDTRDGK
jgi:oligo-1,6-glucosidase